jgi:heptosyltransferase-2
MTAILVLKTAALGDVLRTTALLPGLAARWPESRVTWVTAPDARALLETNPRIERVLAVDTGSRAALAALREELSARPWDLVLSLDDEEPLCALASALAAGGRVGRLFGARLDEQGRPVYSDDSAPWFDMGLLSRLGKESADRLKRENRTSHPALFARMLGVEPAEPELVLPASSVRRAADWAREHGLAGERAAIGLNTGAGGRWTSKQLPVARTVALAQWVAEALEERPRWVVFGGPGERERNALLVEELAAAGLEPVDAGCDNTLLDFAARLERCDVVVTSDSLALHVAIARKVRVVAFFAPTPGAEIELWGRGEKVESTAPDYASYLPDADTSTLTPERLAAAVLRQLARSPRGVGGAGSRR